MAFASSLPPSAHCTCYRQWFLEALATGSAPLSLHTSLAPLLTGDSQLLGVARVVNPPPPLCHLQTTCPRQEGEGWRLTQASAALDSISPHGTPVLREAAGTAEALLRGSQARTDLAQRRGRGTKSAEKQRKPHVKLPPHPQPRT